MVDSDEYILVGRLSGLYGVQGGFRVFSHTRPRANILEYSPWYLKLDGRWVPYQVKEGRVHGKGVVVNLASVDDRDLAATLVGTDIAIQRKQLPRPQQDEYYWTDLAGLKVLTSEGVELGVVDHLVETGANDVLVVKGDRERLIPFTLGNAVVAVDLQKGVITVDWDPDF